MMTIHFQNDDVVNCDVLFGKKKKCLLFTISANKFSLVHFANIFIALKTFCFEFIVQPVSFTYRVRRTHDSFDTLEASATFGWYINSMMHCLLDATYSMHLVDHRNLQTIRIGLSSLNGW